MKFLLFLAAGGSILGGLFLMSGLLGASSAVQESAAAAYACAFAVIPYVFARACQLWSQADVEEKRHAELLNALGKLKAGTDLPPAHAERATAPAQPKATEAPKLPAAKKGRCPNCGHVNLMDSLICTKCNAIFEEGAVWKLEPLP